MHAVLVAPEHRGHRHRAADGLDELELTQAAGGDDRFGRLHAQHPGRFKVGRDGHGIPAGVDGPVNERRGPLGARGQQHAQHHRGFLEAHAGAVPFQRECHLQLGGAAGEPVGAGELEVVANFRADQGFDATAQPVQGHIFITGPRAQFHFANQQAVHLRLDRIAAAQMRNPFR